MHAIQRYSDERIPYINRDGVVLKVTEKGINPLFFLFLFSVAVDCF